MKIVTLLFFFFLTFAATASGIRGTVKADDGSPLAFATIYVKQQGTGAATDLNGNYEVALNPGQYDVIFQYLGYESQAHKVDIGNDFKELNVTLKS